MKITYSDYTKIYENYLKLGEQFAEQANDANFNAKAFLTEKLNAFKALENPTREDQLQLLTEYIGIKNIVGESVMEKDDATLEAFENIIKNFWDTKKQAFQNKALDIMWARSVVLLALETYYKCTEDADVLDYLQKDKEFWVGTRQDTERRDWLLTVGGGNNPGLDDASWSCLGFMIYYRLLGDEYCLELCHDLIGNAFDYLADNGDPSTGLWYRRNDKTNPAANDQNQKSVCGVGLLLTELEYYNLTKGTEKEDAELHERAMGYYTWLENNLRRGTAKTWQGTKCPADNLYWMAFYVNPNTKTEYPWGATAPNQIAATSSNSSLFANMSMCVINKKLYDMTGEKQYLDKVISTATSISTKYDSAGIYLNDRDAWANCAFVSYFIDEVLPLEGVPAKLSRMFVSTALSIQQYALYEGDYYGGDWGASTAWGNYTDLLGDPTRATTSCNTINMLLGGYYVLCKGLTAATDAQAKKIPVTTTYRKLPK